MSLFSKLFNKKPEQTARQDEKSTTPFWDFDKMTLKQFYNKEAAFRHPQQSITYDAQSELNYIKSLNR